MINLKSLIEGDKVLWFFYFFLSMASLLIIYSASADDYSPLLSMLNQAKWLIGGFFVMLTLSRIPFFIWANLSWYLYMVALLMLLWGIFDGGDKRSLWGFQPLEFAKVVLIIVVAKMIILYQDRITEKSKFFSIILVICIMVFSIMVIANSSAMLLAAVCFAMLLVAKAKIKHLCFTGFFGVFLFLGLNLTNTVLNDYIAPTLAHQPSGVPSWVESTQKAFKMARFETSTGRTKRWYETMKYGIYKEEENLQFDKIRQEQMAVFAIASSGLTWGTGPGNSNFRNQFPKTKNDMAFAILFEEYGLIVSLVVMLCYLGIFVRAGMLIRNSEKIFPAMLVMGFSTLITFQAIAHMFVVSGLLPNTGQNLPLISSGGSSVLSISIMFGIMLNISRKNIENSTETNSKKGTSTKGVGFENFGEEPKMSNGADNISELRG